MMAAAHFTPITCEPNAPRRHKKSHILAIFIPERLAILCMLVLKILYLFCMFFMSVVSVFARYELWVNVPVTIISYLGLHFFSQVDLNLLLLASLSFFNNDKYFSATFSLLVRP